MIHKAFGAAALLATTMLSMPAQAQNAQPADEADAPAATLGDIIVTAQRRAENIQRVPISITSLSGADLEAQGRFNVQDALTNVPSVAIQGAVPQGSQVFIRGIGSNGDTNYTDPAIALTVDGVYSGQAEQAVGSIYDVARVEVLRGPQGTLYGRNATGGAINIVTNDPTLDRISGSFDGQVANQGAFRLTGAVNLPLSNVAALRVAGVYDDHGTYYDNNSAGDFHQAGARMKLLLKPSDDLSLVIQGDYLVKRGYTTTTVPNPDYAVPPGQGGPVPPVSLPWDGLSSNPWYVDSLHPPQYDDSKFFTLSARLEYDMGWAVLTAIPSYSFSHRIQIGSLLVGELTGPIDAAANTYDYRQRQYTGEIRIASPAHSPVTWVVGAYGLSSNNAPPEASLFGGDGIFIDLGGLDRPVRSYALFAQVTYPLTDRFRVTGGLRHTWDKKSQDYHYVSYAIPGYDSGVIQLEQKSSAFTYKVGAEYDLAPQSLVYANVSSGYKAGGIAPSSPPTTYRPERLTAFEIGSKNQFLNGKLRFNAEAFLYKYKNMQFQTAVYEPYPIPAAYIDPVKLTSFLAGGDCQGLPPNCQLTLPYINAPTATTYGAEGELEFLLTPNDQFSLTVSYLHARLGDVVIPGQLFGFGGVPGGDIATYTDATGALHLNGLVSSFSPTWSGTVSYQHRFEFAGGDLLFHAQSKLSTGYWATNNRTFTGAYQKSFTRSDANLTYTSHSGWSLGAFVTNIENKAQNIEAFFFHRRIITDPRVYGLRAGLNF